MPTATSTNTATKSRASIRALLMAGLIGGIIATGLNTVIFFAGQAVNGSPLFMTTAGSATPEPLTLFMVVLLSLIPGVVAGAAYWGLGCVADHPRRWFLVLAGLVFLAFFFGPFSAASGAITVAVLELMHVGAAVPIVWSVLRAHR